MKEIAVLGTPEFTLGFRLTGIKRVIDTPTPAKEINQLFNDDSLGIVIIDEHTMSSLDEYTKETVIASLRPVFVVVSTTAAQEELRKMIIQSIGVDLMKEEK